MSSSGQAPNVSMDDLLSSIKSMIEGESSGEANSQVGANLDTGLGGADAPGQAHMQGNDALDDGIMDLTQVVSPPQDLAPQGQAPEGQNPLAQSPYSQSPQGGQPQQDPQNQVQAQSPLQMQDGINPAAQPDMAGQDSGGQDSFGQPPVQEQQAPGQFAQDPAFNNQGGHNPLLQGQDAGQSAQDAAAKLDDIFSNMDGTAGMSAMNEGMGGDIGLPAQNAPEPQAGGVGEQPVVPLDQGGPQFSGAMEGQMPPESGVPHPGFLPDADGQAVPLQDAGFKPQDPQGQQPNLDQGQMGGVQPLTGSNSGEVPLGEVMGRPEQMGGHDPRLENEIAMGQALSQADASLNLSNGLADEAQRGQQQMSPQQQMQQGQMPHGQAPQGQMRGLPPVQQQGAVNSGMAHQMHGQNPGQMPVPGQQLGQQPGQHMQGGMGQVPQPYPMQGQMVPQGQMQGGAMGAPQMGGPQGGADMLPVPSGFRPVLPAVHGQGDAPMPGAMGDQLPVEMKNNLEEIVKQLLKPLLRDWLERNLPELLKGVVDEETGKIDPNKW